MCVILTNTPADSKFISTIQDGCMMLHLITPKRMSHSEIYQLSRRPQRTPTKRQAKYPSLSSMKGHGSAKISPIL